MKHLYYDYGMEFEGVAPRTGAWIETSSRPVALAPGLVAPRTGAWIETSSRQL